MNTFYIVATDRMSWGRGTHIWEALGHALQHAGRKATKAVIFEVKVPEAAAEKDIYVNEMGSIVAPKGSEVKDLDTIPLEQIAMNFYAYYDSVDFHLSDEPDNG